MDPSLQCHSGATRAHSMIQARLRPPAGVSLAIQVPRRPYQPLGSPTYPVLSFHRTSQVPPPHPHLLKGPSESIRSQPPNPHHLLPGCLATWLPGGHLPIQTQRTGIGLSGPPRHRSGAPSPHPPCYRDWHSSSRSYQLLRRSEERSRLLLSPTRLPMQHSGASAPHRLLLHPQQTTLHPFSTGPQARDPQPPPQVAASLALVGGAPP